MNNKSNFAATTTPVTSIITLKFRSGGTIKVSRMVAFREPPFVCFAEWRRDLNSLAAAAGAAGLHALALADLHGGLVVDGGVTRHST